MSDEYNINTHLITFTFMHFTRRRNQTNFDK